MHPRGADPALATAAKASALEAADRWRDTGAIDALREAVSSWRTVLAHTDDTTTAVSATANLGALLQVLYEADQDADPTASVSLLVEAIQAHRSITEGLPDGQLRDRQYANLANALRLHHEAVGDEESLFAGIAAASRVVPEPPWDPIGARRASTLALLLGIRYRVLGSIEDIHRAIDLHERALTADLNPETRRKILGNLATALLDRGSRLQDPDDVTRSMQAAAEALATATPADLPGCLTNAGLAALEASRLGGDTELAEQALAHFEESAILGGTAVERSSRLLHLSGAHRLLYELSGNPADIERATTTAAQAHDLAIQPQDRAAAIAAEGRAFWTRYLVTRDEGDARRAIAARARVADDPEAPLFQRFDSARTAGDWAMTFGDSEAASAHYGTALDIVPLLGWLALESESQEHEAARLAGLSSDAAAAAIVVDDVERALADVDRGRAVIWRQQLDARVELPDGFDVTRPGNGD